MTHLIDSQLSGDQFPTAIISDIIHPNTTIIAKRYHLKHFGIARWSRSIIREPDPDVFRSRTVDGRGSRLDLTEK